MTSRALALALCLGLPGAVLAVSDPAGDERPNVIFILLDDLAYWEVGAHGNELVETPTLDELAAEGVTLTSFYASPSCSISRAAFMTGRHHLRTGAFATYPGRNWLDREETTLGELMQAAGYATGLVGKWHLGSSGEYHPRRQGFDRTFIANNSARVDPVELEADGEIVAAKGHSTDILTDQAIRFVEDHRERRFFLYLAHLAPHSPWVEADRRVERFLAKGLPLRTSKIYAAIQHVDEAIGRLLARLDELELATDTLVLISSDNGGTSTHFKAGFNGVKGSVLEGGIRVPFIARWPSRFPRGAVVDAQAQHIDVFPTLAAVAGAEPAPTLDGKSLLELLEGGEGESPHDFLFTQSGVGAPVISWTDTTRVQRRLRGVPHPNWSIRDRDGLKLVVDAGHRDGALFDLAADPGETIDLSAERPAVVARLRQEFESWFREVTADEGFEDHPRPVGAKADTLLTPAEAEVGGADQLTTFGGLGQSISGWVEGAAASWSVDVMKPGRYEVLLDYACPPGCARALLEVELGGSRLVHELRETAGRAIFRLTEIGCADLAVGQTALRATVSEAAAPSRMVLRGVRLRRGDIPGCGQELTGPSGDQAGKRAPDAHPRW